MHAAEQRAYRARDIGPNIAFRLDDAERELVAEVTAGREAELGDGVILQRAAWYRHLMLLGVEVVRERQRAGA